MQMGLDMYLDIRSRGRKDSEGRNVCYWRKSNQIHGWFERNVCNGNVDNCELYPVSKDDLNALIDACTAVLEDHSKASEILPVQSGFFFGSQGYDDRYFFEIERTKDVLTKIVNTISDQYELFYYAWW